MAPAAKTITLRRGGANTWAAKAYGERLCAERFLAAIAEADQLAGGEQTSEERVPASHALTLLYRLFAQNALGDGTWAALTPTALAALRAEAQVTTKLLAPIALPLATDAFALTPGILRAPIASDWIDYNATEGLAGEVAGWCNPRDY